MAAGEKVYDQKDAAIVPGYTAKFRKAAAQLAASNGEWQRALEPVKQSQLNFNIGMENLTDELNKAIGPKTPNLTGTLGEAFGSIVAGTADAGEAMQAAFGGILQSIAGFMSEFGQQLIVKSCTPTD